MESIEDTMSEYDKKIDTTGLNCPLPLLRTKKALVTMESGQVLFVISTDPSSVVDFKAFAAQSGHELLEYKQEQGRFLYLLRKQ